MLRGGHPWRLNPRQDGLSGVLRDFQANRLRGLALDDRHAVPNGAADNQIGEFQPNKIASTQLAVDGQVEERQVPQPRPPLQSPFRPDCVEKVGVPVQLSPPETSNLERPTAATPQHPCLGWGAPGSLGFVGLAADLAVYHGGGPVSDHDQYRQMSAFSPTQTPKVSGLLHSEGWLVFENSQGS